MSQQSVISFLEKHKGTWFTVKEISKIITDISKGSISINLTKLRRNKLVNFRMDEFGSYEYCFR